MKYNSTISKNELLMHTKTKMNLKIIMLSKGSQTKKVYTIRFHIYSWASQLALVVKKKKKKNLPANAGDVGFDLQVGMIPWRRKWQPTPVFLPGKFQRQRRLAGYSP